MKPTYTDFELPVTVAGVRFRNPICVSSGPTTMSIEQIRRIEETGWGGASLKLTVHPVPYINRKPRYGWFPKEAYLAFTAEKRLTLDELLRLLEQSRKETSELVIASNITYSGEDIEGWVRMAQQCEAAGAHINEINMGCPNMSFNVEMTGEDTGGPKTGASMGLDPQALRDVVSAVKAETSAPVFVRLCPEGGGLGRRAKIVLEAGADGVGSNANRLAVPPINLDEPGRSSYHLQDEIGMACMSGPWCFPSAKRECYEIRRTVGRDGVVTAAGGVSVWRDAVEMAMCGADLIGLCTATIVNGFDFMPEFLHDLKQWLKDQGHRSLREVRDAVVESITSAPDLTLYDGYAQIRDPGLSAPCVYACPAHVPAQGYVRSVAQRDFETAYQLIVSKNPLQSICGKICDHPCESACVRQAKDEPLRIRDIKDFVLEYAKAQGWKPDVLVAEPRTEKIAVVGSGPAGLSAAYDLARAGYPVTVFDRAREPGGALRYLIPSFRLGAETLDEEIDAVRALGVQFRMETALGRDITLDSLKQDGFAAIFLGFGTGTSARPDVPGEDAEGCYTALEFLTKVRDGDTPWLRGVGVIGGGFTAIDVARSCIRLGAEEVYVFYRRTKDEMPAVPEEVREAEEEGVRVMYLVSPQEVLVNDGRVAGLSMLNQVLGEEDASGRRRSEAVEGTEFTLDLDTVIFAISQRPEELKGLSGGEFVEIDERTGATRLDGVFAGGDCVGPTEGADVIRAVAAGKRAAVSIDRKLAGEDAVLAYDLERTEADVEKVLRQNGEDPRRWRVPAQLRPAGQRVKDWEPYRPTMTEDEAVAEAARCYGCGCGIGCGICVQLCTHFAWQFEGARSVSDQEKCVGCGMCVWRCPSENIEIVRQSDEPV